MKRTVPLPLDISSDDDDDDKPSPSNGTKNIPSLPKRPKLEITVINPAKKVITEELLTKSAKMYQEYMKEIPIPTQHQSIIPFSSWTGLAKSMKQMYHQPLHYLTNIRMKEWDQMRNSENDDAPLDTIIHPCKAETNIWLMEEVHRMTLSHQYLAKLWIDDPMYYTFVDSVVPQL